MNEQCSLITAWNSVNHLPVNSTCSISNIGCLIPASTSMCPTLTTRLGSRLMTSSRKCILWVLMKESQEEEEE